MLERNVQPSMLKIADNICETLPEGWQINIFLEYECGIVELIDPNGEAIEYPANHEGIVWDMENALEYAIKHQ